MPFDPLTVNLKLYNTATRQKEVLKPQEGRHVKMYTCGPTVYHYAHLGNFRTYIFEDLLRRTIKFFGMTITQVMNLTDVDDKTIKGAIAKNISLDEYTKPFKDVFFEDLKTLRIEPVEHYPAATEYIDKMILIIQNLVDKGIAYKGGDGSIYYAISKFPSYGCLSHLNLHELKPGASERVASDEYDKEHLADFVLWKKYDSERDGKIFWDSPFGPGRPGWHIECSAMAIALLGHTLDIHVGGIDNMFPHHENEIAQSEAYSGCPFAKMWLHSEHLVVDGKKMSKRLGNFYTLRELIAKGYTGNQVRYMLLQTHYKTQLNFTLSGLKGINQTLQRLDDFILRIREVKLPGSTGAVDDLVEISLKDFSEALADDLNISVALAVVFDLVKHVNCLCDAQKVLIDDAKKVMEVFKKFDSVLGVLTFEKEEEAIPLELEEALQKRNQARKEKNWALSDSLRDFIFNKGYTIEDTNAGARLKKNKG
jgi:cysteinyl-tRNA synthetase